MKTNSAGFAYGLTLAGGALLWLFTNTISGRAEAWDSPFYWSVAYPLAILLAGVAGYLVPHQAWRWGLSVMLVQALVLAATAAGFSLLPLGMLLFAILSLPAIALARFGANMRRRRAP